MTKPGAIRRRALIVMRGIALIAAVSLVCYRTELNSASTALVLFLAVVLQSLDSSFLESAVISILAGASFDYFFLEPRLSLRVARPSDAITVACLLLTSLIVTRLQSRVREEMRESRIQRANVMRLYHLSRDLLSLEPALAFGPEMLQPILANFEVKGVCAFNAGTLESYTAGECRPELEQKTREAYIAGEDFNDWPSEIAIRCLRVRGSVVGAIGFEGLQNPEIVIPPLTASLAAALETARALRAATHAAAQAETEVLRSAILDALAHEIKTPLSAILTAAGGIRSSRSIEAGAAELAELIEGQASRLAELTSRLIRIARLEREDIKPRMECVSANELTVRISRRYAELWPDRRISLIGCATGLEILADPELILLALSQLLENAFRYSVPDTDVVLGASLNGNEVFFTVLNEGIPIPAAERGLIFERFYRGSNAKRSTAGTGLGLYVARKIAVAHGGNITVQEAGPHQVAFRMSLPLAAAEVLLGV